MSLVGEIIEAHCTRCERLLAHVVLFEVNGVVSRVKCRTCGTEHKFRGKKPVEKRTPATLKSRVSGVSKKPLSGKSVRMEDLQRWQTKQGQLTVETAIRSYQMTETYRKGEIINHDSFGLGFIEKIIFDTQMDVLFQDGMKRMSMNIKTAK